MNRYNHGRPSHIHQGVLMTATPHGPSPALMRRISRSVTRSTTETSLDGPLATYSRPTPSTIDGAGSAILKQHLPSHRHAPKRQNAELSNRARWADSYALGPECAPGLL